MIKSLTRRKSDEAIIKREFVLSFLLEILFINLTIIFTIVRIAHKIKSFDNQLLLYVNFLVKRFQKHRKSNIKFEFKNINAKF